MRQDSRSAGVDRNRRTAEMEFSTYQRDFFRELLEGDGNLVLRARAGSGKTFTLKHSIAKLIEDGASPRGLIYVAFNNHVRAEAEETFKADGIPVAPKSSNGVEVRTTHSCGFRMVRRHFFAGSKRTPKNYVDGMKYRQIVRELVERVQGAADGVTSVVLPLDTLELLEDANESRKVVSATVRLIDLVRNNLTPRDGILGAIDALVDAHDLELDDDALPFIRYAVPRACSIGLSRARETIDFGDMVWLPNVLDLSTPWFSFVLVDEAQDLTVAQREIVKRLRGRSARMVFVGDDRQAIYGFAGADVDSFNSIITDLDAKVLPLSVCYRSPVSHLELAREIVPDIESAPNAEIGILDACSEDELSGRLVSGDLVLCRTTAPLISRCLEAIASGVHACVRGRDIGAMIFSTAKRVAKSFEEFTAPALVEFAYRWLAVQIDALGPDADESVVERLEDRVSCIDAIVDMSGPVSSLDEFKARIDGVFSDEKPAIWFSTVHRSKGLEEDRVFLMRPDLLPHPRARAEWQRTQEENLRYIAMTRARRELVFVERTSAEAAKTRAVFAERIAAIEGAA